MNKPFTCIVLSFAATASAMAGGGWFNSWILDEGEAAWAAAPSVAFWAEAEQMISEATPSVTAKEADQEAAESESLAAYLTVSGIPADEQTAVLDAHRLARRIIRGDEAPRPGEGAQADNPIGALEDSLPEGFYLYLLGAYHYHNLLPEEPDTLARAPWEQLVREEPAGFRYRLVWAHYMLGRLANDTEPAYARRHFRKTRELAIAGYPDPLGLAAKSYGWEARSHYLQDEFGEAIHLYLKANATGLTDTSSLIWSLEKAFNQSEEILLDYARDPLLRRILTIWVSSPRQYYPYNIDAATRTRTRARWYRVLQQLTNQDPASTDYLALIAYQTGAMDEARKWNRLSSVPTLANRWLAAKLSSVDGDFEAATEHYTEAIALLRESSQTQEPKAPNSLSAVTRFIRINSERTEKRLSTELGLIHLERRDYQEALRLLAPDHREDAAFLAERILTTDELVTFVDRFHPEAAPPDESSRGESLSAERTRRWMRALLARRLVREGRIGDAVPYFDNTARDEAPSARQNARRLLAALNRAHDENLPPGERAEAYWEAARITRHNGITLLATELDPDWAIYAGTFTRFPLASIAESSHLLSTLVDENYARIRTTEVEPNKRFHYRYIAAEYGWQASLLLPDNDERTAEILWQTGRWLMNRDPHAADRFYKALVNRNRQLPIGQAADQLRWFPPEITPAKEQTGHP